jgi:hypothetical protein
MLGSHMTETSALERVRPAFSSPSALQPSKVRDLFDGHSRSPCSVKARSGSASSVSGSRACCTNVSSTVSPATRADPSMICGMWNRKPSSMPRSGTFKRLAAARYSRSRSQECMSLFIRKEDQHSEDRLLANACSKDYIRSERERSKPSIGQTRERSRRQ